ncbi:MAG: MGMT family protein [Candidatus Omnitrophica bacterium]|nr:MGMT family protein [Candidatus Omnitrophota bacterium]
MSKKGSFTKRVLQEVVKIPLGYTVTYKEIAARAGNPKAARAVGNILKHNRWVFFIPCHRVIKSSGDIGGYALGKKLKRELIIFEQKIKNMLK